MAKFAIKKIDKSYINRKKLLNTNNTVLVKPQNNVNVNIDNMDTKDKIMIANDIINQETKSINRVKKVVKDKGLIERTESSKILLTEDNKELLMD